MKAAAFIALGFALALALSFVLSGIEAGVPLLSRIRIRTLSRQKRTSARILQGLLDRPEEFLWTVLVGNTLALFAVLCGSLYVLNHYLVGHRWLLFGLLAIVAFLLYAVADLFPKVLFRKFPHRLCLALARPFWLIHLVLRPAVWAVARFADLILRLTGGRRFGSRLFGSREELRSIMQESASSLSAEEVAMVNRVLELQSRNLGSLMTPMSRVKSVAPDLPMAEFLRLCRETGRDRYPVLDVSGGRVIGMMSLREALYRSDVDLTRPVRTYMAAPFHLDPDLRLEEALKQLQRSDQRLAILRDRRQRELGLVTLGDVLRFLFGEVHL